LLSLATFIFLIFNDEAELGAGTDPAGMALTPLPSSVGQGLNPQPSDRETSALPLDHSFCCNTWLSYRKFKCANNFKMNRNNRISKMLIHFLMSLSFTFRNYCFTSFAQWLHNNRLKTDLTF